MGPKATWVAGSHELTKRKARERKNTVNKQLNYFVACITAHVRIKQPGAEPGFEYRGGEMPMNASKI
jgi:hypothetical protein